MNDEVPPHNPAANVRFATFNVENLFARYRFRANMDPLAADGFTVNDTAFDLYDDEAKRITAHTIRDVDADIVCLQEVENLTVLERFASRYLASEQYVYRLVIDAKDPRKIDIAILSRYPIAAIRTNRHLRNAANTAALFTRDCLEVDFSISTLGGDTRVFTVVGNHLKSMMGGRAGTHDRRREQAVAVTGIVNDRFGPAFTENFVVAGDMNDYPQGATALDALLTHAHLVNAFDRISNDENERYTHYYKGGGSYRQLDYILIGSAFDARAGNPVPFRNRQGFPWRAERYAGERYAEVGEHHPKASDHVPIAIDIPKTAFV